LYANFKFCFSFWGNEDPLPGFATEFHWGTSVPQTLWPSPHHGNLLRCEILGTHALVAISLYPPRSYESNRLYKKYCVAGDARLISSSLWRLTDGLHMIPISTALPCHVNYRYTLIVSGAHPPTRLPYLAM